jgi:hydrogenase expression/formation protein HypD
VRRDGLHEYEPLVEKFHVPIVVTGFEPLDVLDGIRRCVLQLEQGRGEVENAYARAVRAEGNVAGTGDARRGVRGVRPPVARHRDSSRRAAGGCRSRTRFFDAERRFDVGQSLVDEPARCRCGDVLQGVIKPDQCECFGRECTPRTPMGATMVSSEGACAAYFQYRRIATPAPTPVSVEITR